MLEYQTSQWDFCQQKNVSDYVFLTGQCEQECKTKMYKQIMEGLGRFGQLKVSEHFIIFSDNDVPSVLLIVTLCNVVDWSLGNNCPSPLVENRSYSPHQPFPLAGHPGTLTLFLNIQ